MLQICVNGTCRYNRRSNLSISFGKFIQSWVDMHKNMKGDDRSEIIRKSWKRQISWICPWKTHPSPLVICNKISGIRLMRWLFWVELCWQATRQSSISYPPRNLKHHMQLDRQFILWFNIRLVLKTQTSTDFHARVHPKRPPKFQTSITHSQSNQPACMCKNIEW